MCICSAVCEILGSHSGVAEYASLLGCEAAITRTTCQRHFVTSQGDLHIQLCAWP